MNRKHDREILNINKVVDVLLTYNFNNGRNLLVSSLQDYLSETDNHTIDSSNPGKKHTDGAHHDMVNRIFVTLFDASMFSVQLKFSLPLHHWSTHR